MKSLLTALLTLAIFALGINAQAQTPELKSGASYIMNEEGNLVETTKPIIDFKIETHDFGELAEGPKVTHEFKFTNVGKEPLVIDNVRASCGCTTPDWPREPIAPGESDVITVIYNTKKRLGPFNKAVTITSNAYMPTKRLYIKGKVIHAEQAEELIIEETTPIKKSSIILQDDDSN